MSLLLSQLEVKNVYSSRNRNSRKVSLTESEDLFLKSYWRVYRELNVSTTGSSLYMMKKYNLKIRKKRIQFLSYLCVKPSVPASRYEMSGGKMSFCLEVDVVV